MEDTTKIDATLASLEGKDKKDWTVVPLAIEKIDTKDKSTSEVKVFICAETGDVREYPIKDYIK